MKRCTFTAALLGLVLSAGCSASPGDPPTTESPGHDAGTAMETGTKSDDAGAGADAGACATWTCLYTDFFGPTGAANCAGSGTCHGSPEETGFLTSLYLCPPGDKDGCYMGITSSQAGLITPGAFDGTRLYANLRKSTGGGTMPKTPAYAFAPADLARIGSWVAAGAKDD
jgi:hypothetical protein